MRAVHVVALLVAVVATVALATSPYGTVRDHWTKLHCAPQPDATASFQVYLNLENEAVLAAHANGEGLSADVHAMFGPVPTAEIEDTLAYWRGVLRPTDETVVRANSWMKPALRFCQVHWDSIHCKQVPASVVKAIFHANLCAYAAKSDGAEFLFLDDATTNDDGTMKALPAFVHSIHGLALFNPKLQPMRVNPTVRTPAAAAGTIPRLDWPSTMPTGSPLILQAVLHEGSMGPIVLALYCQNGTMATTNHLTPGFQEDWCGSANAFPSQIQLNLYNAAANADHTFSVPITTESCAPFNNTGPYVDQLICTFSDTIALTLPREWIRFQFQAKTSFSAGADSQWSALRNFWRGEFQTAPFSTNQSEVTLINPEDLLPSDFTDFYGVPANVSLVTHVTQGVVELASVPSSYHGFHVSMDDLATFLADIKVTTKANATQYVQDHLQIIHSADYDDRAETTLDVEMLMAIAPGAKTIMFNILYGATQTYTSAMAAVTGWAWNVTSGASGMTMLPQVWSISYAGPEWGPQSDRLEIYLRMMTVSGVSVAAATGDWGAGFFEPAPGAPYLVPSANYPATSPSVLAVGATSFERTHNAEHRTEIVCSAADGNSITTGGGFSGQFPRPAYQALHVQQYINDRAAMLQSGLDTKFNGNAFNAQYPAGARAIPDVAANGAWIRIFLNGTYLPVFGTSASTPIVAAMITLMNEQRAIKGNSSLALIHQLFYQQNNTFNDVKQGSNCAGEMLATNVNFPTFAEKDCYFAAEGWDAVSGLGTVGYQTLQKASMDFVPNNDVALPEPKQDRWYIALFGLLGLILAAAVPICAYAEWKKRHTDAEANPLRFV